VASPGKNPSDAHVYGIILIVSGDSATAGKASTISFENFLLISKFACQIK